LSSLQTYFFHFMADLSELGPLMYNAHM